jgi:molybdopterin molybdotransferase
MTQPVHLSYDEARRRVLAASAPGPIEDAALADARGRALRAELRAPHALPPFDNSAMDGWALRAADLAAASPASPVTLAIGEVVAAGHVPSRAVGPGEAARIMTGAMIPAGADAVVPFEQSEALPMPSPHGLGAVRLTAPVLPGSHVRPSGADVRTGGLACAAGRELSAHDLALLAALGFARVPVGVRPRVAILSTGDELLDAAEPLRPGAIRESNVPQLTALLEECGARVALARRLHDDPAEVGAAIRDAMARADVTLTIGGVSEGDFDPVRQAIDSLPGVELWRVAMRPGRPQAFGAPGGRLYFGLPGNPASVACVFEVLVRPALRRLQGFAALDRPTIEVRAAARLVSAAGRRDFLRVTLAQRDDGWWAEPAGAQVSGHLSTQSRAHALLDVPEAVAALEPGERARALVLRWPEAAA